jgi:AAA domain, putative AbiEii toxin, Type IV TA system
MPRIHTIKLHHFKRFADLSVQDIPESVRMVVLSGPNGNGKSSLFDALRVWSGRFGNAGWQQDDDYYIWAAGRRTPSQPVTPADDIQVTFHGIAPAPASDAARKAFHFRSAYRNDPDMSVPAGSGQLLPQEVRHRFFRMVENDAAVVQNYRMLVSNAFEGAFVREASDTLIGAWRDRVIRDLRDPMARLFPGLTLNGLGSPLRDPTFRFDKGTSRSFMYKNLSGGEKAAFDLLLDFVVMRDHYDNTIYCVDEPETHLNPRLHGALLGEMLALVPEQHCQLWIATHALGMLRAARDIQTQNPGSVAFLDFGGDYDFDRPTVMSPIRPTRAFWERALAVALDDMASLVAPSTVVICEGNPRGDVPGKNAEHDARCYNVIFGDDYPDVKFVSGGNSHDVANDRLKFVAALPSIVQGITMKRLIDRDDHSDLDVADFNRKGVSVLSRRHLESFLYDDEVIRALCVHVGQPEKSSAAIEQVRETLAASAALGKPSNDIKAAAGDIFNRLRRLLQLRGMGDNAPAFARNALAPLIRSGMQVYDELRQPILS